MQTKSRFWEKLSVWGNSAVRISVAFGVILTAGCSGNSTPSVSPTRTPYANVSLKVGCPEAVLATELSRRVLAWSQRTGAKVTFVADANAAADCAVIAPRELGAWIAKKDVQPVPEAIRSAEHPAKWSGFLNIYSERLGGWGGEPQSVPIAGEAYVLAYRADRFSDATTADAFSKKFGRSLVPPTTWEDLADIAEFFGDRGTPSLPPLPDEPNRALRDWHMIAACYDRLAQSTTSLAAQMKGDKERFVPSIQMLAFHHDLETGEPRLSKPGFVRAAALFKRLGRCRSPQGSDDPAASLTQGTAVLAVLSLQELGRLPRTNAAAPAFIGIAPLPGTKVWYDPKDGTAHPPADKVKGVNYVPYFGSGAIVGIVRNSCPNPEAGFALLTELASVERSAELASDPLLGFGPLRVEHLDQSRESIWQRYGFDAERNRQLAEAIRHYMGIGLANPVYSPRSSDQAVLMQSLAKELASTATPEQSMKNAEAAWKKQDATRPAEVLKAERRQSAGLRVESLK